MSGVVTGNRVVHNISLVFVTKDQKYQWTGRYMCNHQTDIKTDTASRNNNIENDNTRSRCSLHSADNSEPVGTDDAEN